MKKVKQMWWSVFGSLDAYIATRPDEEKRFWTAPSPAETTSVWAAAKAHPKGLWYVIRVVLVRQILPAALAIVLVTCGLAMIASLLILAAANK